MSVKHFCFCCNERTSVKNYNRHLKTKKHLMNKISFDNKCEESSRLEDELRAEMKRKMDSMSKYITTKIMLQTIREKIYNDRIIKISNKNAPI